MSARRKRSAKGPGRATLPVASPAAGEPAGATTNLDVDPEAMARVLKAVADLGTDATVSKVQARSRVRRADVVAVLADVRAGRIDPKAPTGPRPDVELERAVRAAVTPAALAKVTALAAAAVAGGTLEPSRARAIVDASRESRRALHDEARARADAKTETADVGDRRSALVSEEALSLAVIFDYLSDEDRAAVADLASDLAEEEARRFAAQNPDDPSIPEEREPNPTK